MEGTETDPDSPPMPKPGGARGHTKAENEELLGDRLKRIEGRVRVLQRMVEEGTRGRPTRSLPPPLDGYCW